MCGINGVLALEGSPFQVTAEYVARLRDTMRHRGPDGAGVWVSEDRRVGLGHRRLSIIDLSDAASQPMCNEDGTLWLTFNGEIYNHAEIRAELERIGGHRWKTDHSDTEVILHAFEEWGIDCLNRFRGMFAFGLWDARTRDLWLVRDRVGIKPLYHSMHHGRLVFASEIKALLADPEQARAVAGRLGRDFLRPGGFVTTTIASGQQWDAPNGWPPLQWLAIQGVRRYGHAALADTARARWLALNRRTYAATGKMTEKYDVVDPAREAGGGEYPTQDGFGWSNGVALALSAQERRQAIAPPPRIHRWPMPMSLPPRTVCSSAPGMRWWTISRWGR